MKFKSILIERQLEKSKLPKKLQKKIEQLEQIEEKIEEMEAVAKDPDENEGIAIAKMRLNSLDEEVVGLLKKFDPYRYQIQKEKMAKINEAKYGPVEETEETQETEETDTEEQEQVFEEESVLERIPPISKTLHIKEDLEKLRDEVEVEPDSFQPDRAPLESIVEPEPEVEEFEKHEATKPKKMSKGLILMGVGAFLLTWGAVNFFKERRG